MITVTKTQKDGSGHVKVAIPEGKCPFEVCDQVARSMGMTVVYEEREASERSGREDSKTVVDGGDEGVLLDGREATPGRHTAVVDGPRVAGGEAEPAQKAVPAEGRRAPSLADLFDAPAGVADAPARDPVGVERFTPTVGVRATSAEAYRKIKWDGRLTAQQRVVYEWMKSRIGDATRKEISRGTALAINVVCGRVNELIASGALLETRKRRCRVTGENVNAIAVASS